MLESMTRTGRYPEKILAPSHGFNEKLRVFSNRVKTDRRLEELFFQSNQFPLHLGFPKNFLFLLRYFPVQLIWMSNFHKGFGGHFDAFPIQGRKPINKIFWVSTIAPHPNRVLLPIAMTFLNRYPVQDLAANLQFLLGG